MRIGAFSPSRLKDTLGGLGGGLGAIRTTAGLPLAVDFGVASLKVLQLGGGKDGKPLDLVGGAAIETPDELLTDPMKRLAFQAQALPGLLKNAGATTRRAACSIPAAQTFCKHFQIPRQQGVPVAQAAREVVSAEVGCHPDTLVYRHIEVSAPASAGASAAANAVRNSGKCEVIGIAAHRDLINRLIAALKLAKLEPVGIHPEALALVYGLAAITGPLDIVPESRLVLDLGAGSTKVVITQGERPVFLRTVQLGGRDLDHAYARMAGCSVSEAHSRRLATLAPSATAPSPETAESTDAPEAIETLVDEIAMCLRYFESLFPGQRVARITFVGGESRRRSLCQDLARRLRLPARVADPIATLSRGREASCPELNPTIPHPEWAVAVGLCLSPTDL